MQDFPKWTLDLIRQNQDMKWMEEKRFEWIPLIVVAIKNIVKGYPHIVVTDKKRTWFCQYVLSHINIHSKNRPFLPFVSIESIFYDIDNIKNIEDINLLEDMLRITYGDRYSFFYIGKGNDLKFQIVKRKENSFMWVIDNHIRNSFFLESKDKDLDIKLIQLYKIFDISINSILFNEARLD